VIATGRPPKTILCAAGGAGRLRRHGYAVGQARRADRAGLRQVIGAPVEVPLCGSIRPSPNASPNAKSAQSAVSISRSFTTATRSTSEGELTCRIFPQAEPIDHRDFRRKRQKLRKADSTCRQLRCLGTLRRGSKRRAGELDCAREPDTATVHSRRTPTTARSTQCDRVSDVRVRQRANGSRRIHGCSAQVQGRGRGIAHNSGHRDIRTIVP